jgi:pimeloyl-ACP methyl ester carboxylesterase
LEALNKYISAEYLKDIAKDNFINFTVASGYENIVCYLRFNVKVYRITYFTFFIDKLIPVSGVVYIPESETHVFPLLSVQHGTLFLKSDAPSANPGTGALEMMAAAGYITLQPDYIGYGASEAYFHPYYDQKYAALSVTDMLSAALDFLKHLQVPFLPHIYLMGHSEGGYATLASHKFMESQAHDLRIRAVAVSAGGYDLFGMLASFTQESRAHAQPAYIAFLLMAYEKIYQWNKSLEYYFSAPYAAMLPELMNGKHDSAYINANLTGNLEELFNPEFYHNLKGNGAMELKKSLFVNSIAVWKPSAPVRLYHCVEDEVIPYANSENTYRNFCEQNADNVKLISIPGGSHAEGKWAMIKEALSWFSELH